MAARPGGQMKVLPPDICQLIIAAMPLEALMNMRLTSRWFHAAIRPLSYEQCLVVEKTLFGVLGKPQSREGPILTCFKCIRLRPRRHFAQRSFHDPEHLLHCDTCEKCRTYASRRYCEECRSSWGKELAYHPARNGEILAGTTVLVWCNLCGALSRRGGHRQTEWKLTCAPCIDRFRRGPRESWVHERLLLYRCTPSATINISHLKPKWVTHELRSEFKEAVDGGALEVRRPTLVAELDVHRQASSTVASLLGLPTELQHLVINYVPAEGRASLRLTCFWFLNLIPPLSRLELLLAEASPLFIRLDYLACLRCQRLRLAKDKFGRSSILKSSEMIGHLFDERWKRWCIDCATNEETIQTVQYTHPQRKHPVVDPFTSSRYSYRPGNRIVVGDRLLVWCISCRKVVECHPSFSGQLQLGRNGGTGLACEQCEAKLQESDERPWLKPNWKSINRARKIERKGRQHLQIQHG